MAQLYDSAKVRAAGQAAQTLRENLEEGAMQPGRRAIRESESLRGEAGEALRARLRALEGEAKRICGELGDISGELKRYAKVLEEVGEELTREMS